LASEIAAKEKLQDDLAQQEKEYRRQLDDANAKMVEF